MVFLTFSSDTAPALQPSPAFLNLTEAKSCPWLYSQWVVQHLMRHFSSLLLGNFFYSYWLSLFKHVKNHCCQTSVNKVLLQQIYICFSNPISYQVAKGLLKGKIFKAFVNWIWRAARRTTDISLHVLNTSVNFSCRFSSLVEISDYFSSYFSTFFFL